MLYTCQIELNDITPKIWRQFQFHADVTFDQLHNIIQIVMGWEDEHFYEFRIGRKVIGLPDPFFFGGKGTVVCPRREGWQARESGEDDFFLFV